MSDTDLTVTSVTDGDRVLSGVGVSSEQLEKTMERHAPDGPAAPRDEPASQQPPPNGKVSRGQHRFSELTSQRDKALNKALEVARERDDLRAKLEAASRPAPPPVAMPDPVAPPRPAASEVQTRTKPSENEVGSKYETYADFIEDLADWKAEQRLAAQNFDAKIRQSIEADRASRTRDEHSLKSIERGRSRYADFDTVLKAATHFQSNDWPTYMGEAIDALEQPEHIYYQLAKDPALAHRLKGMSPVQFGMELSKLMPASAVVPPASTGSAGTVTPPPPFQPVGAGSKTTAPPLADLPKKGYDFDASGYRERRSAELGRVTRRR